MSDVNLMLVATKGDLEERREVTKEDGMKVRPPCIHSCLGQGRERSNSPAGDWTTVHVKQHHGIYY